MRTGCFSSKALLRQPGGFEGFGAVGEDLRPPNLAALERIDARDLDGRLDATDSSNPLTVKKARTRGPTALYERVGGALAIAAVIDHYKVPEPEKGRFWPHLPHTRAR